MNDSTADSASTGETGRQIADQRGVGARLIAGAHYPTQQGLSEMRARRRASSVCPHRDLSERAPVIALPALCPSADPPRRRSHRTASLAGSSRQEA